MTPAQYDYVIAARTEGKSYREIGEELGMTGATLSKQVHRGPPKRVRRQQVIDQFLIENVATMGHRAMASAIGCNESSVRRRVTALARDGLLTPPPREPKKITHRARAMSVAPEPVLDSEATYLRLCISTPGGGFPRLSERPAKNGEPIACLPVVWPVQEAA
jgi:hypothetical protein